MISFSQVREDLLRCGCVRNALVLDGTVTVAGILSVLNSPALPPIHGVPDEHDRVLFQDAPDEYDRVLFQNVPDEHDRVLYQVLYMKMACPTPFEIKSAVVGSSRGLLVHLYPACHIAIETDVGHDANKSLRRHVRRVATRHGLEKAP